MQEIEIRTAGGTIRMGNNLPLVCIAGPCAIENRAHAIETGLRIREIMAAADMPCIYKSSFDKANRTSGASYRGVGMEEGLSILADVRATCGLPVLTDIHTPEQAQQAADVVDMLQIPAFLCRQTDLVLAAARTGKPVNIKKGQFLAPGDMRAVVDKAHSAGNRQICVCERGTFFGYGNLVVDMRALDIMKGIGSPVIFDATHSVQLPGGRGACSGGQREFVFPLARAAVAVGVAAVFMEVHPEPDKAPCDGPNMLALETLPRVLQTLKEIDAIAKEPSCER